MRILLCLLLLLSLQINCFASEDDTLPKGVTSRFLVFPFLVRSPETNWGFGGISAFFFKAEKNDDRLRTSDINLLGLYTLNEQTVIVLGSTIFFHGEKKIFRFQGSFSNYPDKFWGLGNDSPEEAKEDYSLQQLFFNPQLLFKLHSRLYIGASIEMQDVNNFSYVQGGVFDTQNIQGRNGGLASGAGILLTWDSRNNAYSPSQGYFAEFNMTKFTDILGSDFKFSSYSLDLRGFFFAGRNRVIAVQTYSKINDGETPVRNLSLLGGPEIMRGYYKGRYADQNMAAIQAELRQYLFWRLGIVGFASVGQVASSVNSFGIGDFHYAFGGGARIFLNKSEKLNLRIDYGFGKGNSGLYVILKEAF